MRGESKYHYVDLALIDDRPESHGGEHFQNGGDAVEVTDGSFARRYATSYHDDPVTSLR